MGIPIGFLWGFTQGPIGILMGIATGFPQEFYGDGMGWDGMGWDGMGWDGMGWDGMGWDGMGWEWEFHSHGNPGINAFVSIQQRPWPQK